MKKKFGIIGNPIKHSLSPVLHKYWFDKYGMDASYSIIEVNDKNLSDVITKIRNAQIGLLLKTRKYTQIGVSIILIKVRVLGRYFKLRLV